MSNSQEIEVEVVEVFEKAPSSKTNETVRPTVEQASKGSQRPFGRGIPIRSIKIPVWMWPLAILLVVLLFVLALVVGLILVIPFLIIRGILRLLFVPSPRH